MLFVAIFFPLFSAVAILAFGRYLNHFGSVIVAIFFLFWSFIASAVIVYEVVYLGASGSCQFAEFFTVGFLTLEFSFIVDVLAVGMLVVVTMVSFLVHLYSINYMSVDPHLPRFMAYLSLFTFFMLILVTADNLFQLFFGWEGVGLCSYLLISFWYTRTQANLSSLKAFIVNRVGDFMFLIGLFIIVLTTQALNFYDLFLLLSSFNKNLLKLFGADYVVIQIILICLFCGAMSKSAQIFLHTWLPDAMEGPTPVSALIHAATMVAAGVFLLARCSFLFMMSPLLLNSIIIIGTLTAFFAASVGFFQSDIKKIIAYSTCSQLGYMVAAAGIGVFSVSMFHLINHAFFKALLFLASGSIIHAAEDNQDFRRMGGFLKILPFTYIMMLVGSVALAGIPFFSGFYSKDLIIECMVRVPNDSRIFFISLLMLSVALTAIYSVKLLLVVFCLNANFLKSVGNFLHESSIILLFPLVVLSFLSIFFGFFFLDFFTLSGLNNFSLSLHSISLVYLLDFDFMPYFLKHLPFILSLFGSYCSALFVFNYSKFFIKKTNIFTFFSKKWFFDNLFNFFIARLFFVGSYKIFIKNIDRGFFELIGPIFIIGLLNKLSFIPKTVQTGLLYHYLLYIVLSVFVALLILFGQIHKVIVLNLALLYLVYVSTQFDLTVEEFINFDGNVFSDKVKKLFYVLIAWGLNFLAATYFYTMSIMFAVYIYKYKVMPLANLFVAVE